MLARAKQTQEPPKAPEASQIKTVTAIIIITLSLPKIPKRPETGAQQGQGQSNREAPKIWEEPPKAPDIFFVVGRAWMGMGGRGWKDRHVVSAWEVLAVWASNDASSDFCHGDML